MSKVPSVNLNSSVTSKLPFISTPPALSISKLFAMPDVSALAFKVAAFCAILPAVASINPPDVVTVAPSSNVNLLLAISRLPAAKFKSPIKVKSSTVAAPPIPFKVKSLIFASTNKDAGKVSSDEEFVNSNSPANIFIWAPLETTGLEAPLPAKVNLNVLASRMLSSKFNWLETVVLPVNDLVAAPCDFKL